MGIFNLIDLGGGHKVTPAKYDEMLQKAADNIILSGFQNEQILIQNLMVNCFGNVRMAIKVITSLQSIYQKRIEEESETMFQNGINCHNILEINNKLRIIGNVLDTLTNDIAAAVKEHQQKKLEEKKLVVEEEEEEYEEYYEDEEDDEDEEYYEDDDEDEKTLEDPAELIKNLVASNTKAAR